MSSAGSRRQWIQRAIAPGLAVFFTFVVSSLVPGKAAAEQLEWTVYAGRWALDQAGETSELGFEIHRPFGTRGFDLVGGLAATADEAVWAYAGASWSWEPSGKWRFRPGFAVSVFENGDGRDLGGPIEFRSSLETTYRVHQNFRLGLLVYHLSNAGFYDLNPGSNSLVFVVGFPGRD